MNDLPKNFVSKRLDMCEKRLLPHTIIPKDLYVLRDADRQLGQVIREMGRPGYVLVARQMGKTNLLLNARRELETCNDVFVYVDLSRHFQSDRECLRTIVDTALDTHPVRFAEVTKRIYAWRKNQELPAYKEHENELRSIIQSITGKLVITLDEIDSLTHASFSDRIFAQVRSVYFSRANYNEFERLTYVLSGVVEPNEIIKDKKISPFNIGQKIYLDDFTESEFEEFLVKAQLNLSGELKRHIYEWTNGNPRITWDVCSAVEDVLLESRCLTADIIDECVRSVYLKEFNRAPVDHIRELVADNLEIRAAVEKLKSEKVVRFSDAIKSKLYLAGIVGSSAGGQGSTIKNKIIDQALSAEWLRDISIAKKGLLNLAVDSYNERRYAEALEYYRQYLKFETFDARTAGVHYLNMGFCSYGSGNYEAALEYFEKAAIKPDQPLYDEKCYLMGLTHFQKQSYKESIDCFAAVVALNRNDALNTKSELNIAAALMKWDAVKHADAASCTLLRVIKTATDNSTSLTDDDRKAVLGVAYHNLGRSAEVKGQDVQARESFAAGAKNCATKDRAAILLSLYNSLENADEKIKVLDELARSILAGEANSRVPSPEHPLVISTSEFAFILGELVSHGKTETFEKLIDFLPQKVLELPKVRQDVVYEVALHALDNGNVTVARIMLLDYYVNCTDAIEDSLKLLTVTKYLALFAVNDEAAKYQDRVVDYLRLKRTAKLNHLDCQVITVCLSRYFGEKKYSKVLDIVELAKFYRTGASEEILEHFALVYFYEMKTNEALGFNHSVTAAAESALEVIRLVAKAPLKRSVLRAGEMDVIKGVAQKVLATASLARTVKPQKFKPNEWIKVKLADGSVKQVKYKKIRADLEAGRCVLAQ